MSGGEMRSGGPFRGMVPKRLRRLEAHPGDAGVQVFVARSFRARLMGLALLRDLPLECLLLIPRCSSVHTFGMRFPLEIRFLNERGRVIRCESQVSAGRMLRQPGAAAVLEWRSVNYAEPTSESRR